MSEDAGEHPRRAIKTSHLSKPTNKIKLRQNAVSKAPKSLRMMDSPSYDRNPSPPPEIVEHSELITAESIGNTAFSKHWLFSTLMKLIEEVDRENRQDSEEEAGGELAIDVDDDLQNELCKLWDMSMNSEVSQFLNEFKAVDILTEVIQKSKAPRVTEICVGILGNMACEQSVCKVMSDNTKLIDLILLLMETRDTPTLVENTRLVHTSLSNSVTRLPWIRAVQRSEDILDHLMFIFSSSTNCDLLKNSAELVDVLLDLEPDLCVSWATVAFIHSLLDATEQIGSNHSEALEVYLHIFQSFSTTESGVESLVEHGSRLAWKIMKYLNIVCEYEIVGVGQKEEPLTSALSVLNILVTTLVPGQLGNILNSEKLMRILLKILEPLYPMLQGYRGEENQSGTSLPEQPITSQQTDQVTSSDQLEAAMQAEVTNSEEKPESMAPAAEKTEVQTKAMDREQYRRLEVLHEILGGLLNDFCGIVFNDTADTVPTTQVDSKDQGETAKPDSTTEDAVTKNSTDLSKGDNPEVTKEPKVDADSDLSKGDNVDMIDDLSKGDNTDMIVKEESTVNSTEEKVDTSPLTQDKSEETTTTTDKNEEDVRVTSPVNCIPILTYLDEACSRCRINYLTLCLKESEEGKLHFEQLQSLAQRHEKQRLCRIFGDINAGKIVVRADSEKQEEVESNR